MKIFKIVKLGLLSLAICATTTSCNDWLQVDTEDSIMEGLLFENDEGYMSALNGVYSKMNELYGSTLSMGMLDVMAQYYNIIMLRPTPTIHSTIQPHSSTTRQASRVRPIRYGHRSICSLPTSTLCSATVTTPIPSSPSSIVRMSRARRWLCVLSSISTCCVSMVRYIRQKLRIPL